MKVRNITGDPVFVPALGRMVDIDEIVTVPAHSEKRVWPESNWEVIPTARKTSKESE